MAVTETGVIGAEVTPRSRLLPDNRRCCPAGELKAHQTKQGIGHTGGRPYYPMTQGNIWRYHRTMKNVSNLDHNYLPWQLEHQIRTFVDYYSHHRVHEFLENLTPVDVYQGRAVEFMAARNLVKEQTLRSRRHINLGLMTLNKQFIRPAELLEAVL